MDRILASDSRKLAQRNPLKWALASLRPGHQDIARDLPERLFVHPHQTEDLALHTASRQTSRASWIHPWVKAESPRYVPLLYGSGKGLEYPFKVTPR